MVFWYEFENISVTEEQHKNADTKAIIPSTFGTSSILIKHCLLAIYRAFKSPKHTSEIYAAHQDLAKN